MVKNLPYNAGDAGSTPGQGTKIPHAVGQLSLCATTTELNASTREPGAANYRAHALCSPRTTTTEPTCPGAYAPQLEKRKPAATTGEKPVRCNKRSRVPQLRPDVAKSKLNK